MGEIVTRIRLIDTGQKDRYNKPIYSEQSTSLTAHVFAPVVASDVQGVDQVTATDGGTIYFRYPNMADALPDDRWEIRGETYKSEGREALWRNASDAPIGTVVVVERSTATTD
jgi:hypothetical protein